MAWYDKFETKPLTQIKRHVVQYHLKKDLETSSGSNCIYAYTCLSTKKYGKQYQLGKFLRQCGFFENAEYRRFFLYSFLDTCAYPRPCPKCGTVIFDTLSHALSACPKARKIRTVLRLKLLLYNANSFVSPTKFECKKTLYSLAMGDRLVRRSLCEILVACGY